MPRSTAAAAPALILALALVLGLGSCTQPTPIEPTRPTGTVVGGTESTGPLARFYTQKLTWSACGGFQCSQLTVPLDYAAPEGSKTLSVKVLRAPARDRNKRLGSLVVNPGGPGASGVAYARAADFIVGPTVRRFYDIVGFDPRGVGASDPIDCLDDSGMDALLSTDPTPDTPAEEQALLAGHRALGAGCAALFPDTVKFVATRDAARDMDILRAALGDDQLSYLGKSYGTFLGATYAGLFPQRVGRFVLDGVLPPDLSSFEMAKGQAEGFERATTAYIADCVATGGCPLGSTPEAAQANLRKLLAQLDAKPIPSGDPSAPQLGEGWAALGMAQALYDQGSWATLTQALSQAVKGDGSGLMHLADQYANREPGGVYEGNMLEAMYAVNCLDRPDSPDLADYEKYAQEISTVAPTWGPFLAWGSLACGVWPVDRGIRAERVTAPGSNPIVVVGTTRDPATPYEWSKRLADQLENATLLTMDGDGHTAYTRGNGCIDKAIDDYYVSGKVPADGTTC